MSPTASQLADLVSLAATAAQNSYAPYSRFFVGAAVLLESGEMATGCNVENASYRLTTCAEQAGIAAAVARYGPLIRIQAVAVYNSNGMACQPCGACRQTIAEFAPPGALILYPAGDGTMTTQTLADLLPSTFQLSARD